MQKENREEYASNKQNFRELVNEWDDASELLDIDPMIPIRYAKALKYLRNLNSESKILEIGCGNGKGLKLFSNYGFTNLTGAEVSKDRIKRAKENLPPGINVHLIGPDTPLPFPDNYFDVVISCAVIEHTVSPNSFMNEIARVLTHNGDCVISSDCFTWRILQKMKLYRTVQPIDRTYTISAFNKIFKASGFSILHADTFNLPQRGSPYIFYCRELFHLGLKKFTRGKWKTKVEDYLEMERQNLKLSPGIISEKWNEKNNVSMKVRLYNYFFDENIFYLKKQLNAG